MSIAELLPWLNLLILPLAGHIMATSNKITRLETKVEMMENHVEALIQTLRGKP